MDAAILTSIVGPVCGVLGVLIKMLWDRMHEKKQTAIQQTGLELDAAAKLRDDLIEERKVLLAQLINSQNREAAFQSQLDELRRQITNLENDNREKDDKIKRYAARMEEQDKTIQALRSELDELKSHEQSR